MSNQDVQARIVVDDLVKVFEPSPLWMRALVRSNVAEPVYALTGVSFTVGAGEICAVVGPNGAGKTTTFKILAGLVSPTSGTASVMGFDSFENSVAVRRAIGWMPGDHRSLFMRHSVIENLRFHGRMQGMSGDSMMLQIKETLSTVGLQGKGKASVFGLSAGMRARLQLARALLHEPQVLILDEPTGSVDPVAAHGLVELIKGIVEEREIGVLVSSHRLEEIETLHSRVLLMDQGSVRYDGNLDELRARWDKPTIRICFRTTASADDAAAILANDGIGTVMHDGKANVICSLNPGVTQADVLARLRGQIEDVVELKETHRPLQTVLADMYKSNEGKK